jgi:phosphoribosyl 1,2-cyclic phosphate phosphodiesterase
MRITLLGTGTSQGVPVIGCGCSVCTSQDRRDNRLRCSVLLQSETTNVVIDTGPDFRQQMLREQVGRIDAVLFTHEHKDHIAGLDDVRPINFRYNMDMPVYATEQVQTALRREYAYAFEPAPYPGIPRILLHTIDKNTPFLVGDIDIVPIEVMHYKLPTMAFRVGDFTYITDAKTIAPSEIDKIRGSKTLVINALHHEEHISHFNLAQALAMIKDIAPERAYLTHLSHHFGLHAEWEPRLPDNVRIGYDGLVVFE